MALRKRTLVVTPVSRRIVVDSTRAAIRHARHEEGLDISLSLSRRLMRVARESDLFAIGDWHIGTCGCLIGNLYGAPVNADDLDLDEYHVGLEFDAQVRDRSTFDDTRANFAKHVYALRVLED